MKTIEFLKAMKHSPVGNYAGIPGLTSWLIGAPSDKGQVRLFECSRDHQEAIIPHSHRFDLHCVVLAGEVHNIVWSKTAYVNEADYYQSTDITYGGEPGQYERGETSRAYFTREISKYGVGDEYSLKSHEIHSIFFGKGSSVLFFEGQNMKESSTILEPVVDGRAVPTFKVEPWMFTKVGQ